MEFLEEPTVSNATVAVEEMPYFQKLMKANMANGELRRLQEDYGNYQVFAEHQMDLKRREINLQRLKRSIEKINEERSKRSMLMSQTLGREPTPQELRIANLRRARELGNYYHRHVPQRETRLHQRRPLHGSALSSLNASQHTLHRASGLSFDDTPLKPLQVIDLTEPSPNVRPKILSQVAKPKALWKKRRIARMPTYNWMDASSDEVSIKQSTPMLFRITEEAKAIEPKIETKDDNKPMELTEAANSVPMEPVKEITYLGSELLLNTSNSEVDLIDELAQRQRKTQLNTEELPSDNKPAENILAIEGVDEQQKTTWLKEKVSKGSVGSAEEEYEDAINEAAAEKAEVVPPEIKMEAENQLETNLVKSAEHEDLLLFKKYEDKPLKTSNPILKRNPYAPNLSESARSTVLEADNAKLPVSLSNKMIANKPRIPVGGLRDICQLGRRNDETQATDKSIWNAFHEVTPEDKLRQ